MNMTEQAAIIRQARIDLAEANTAEFEREERDIDLFVCNANPNKLMGIALHMQRRINHLTLQHESENLKEASNIAFDLVLDLAGAIRDIKGAI